MTRQLALAGQAAIMFTDIVGYTALMGKDEQKAAAASTKSRTSQAHHRAIQGRVAVPSHIDDF